MSTRMLPPFFTIIDKALPSHTDRSVVAYTSMDRDNFDTHLSPIYGSHAICDLTTVLPELHAKFLIQVSNIYTRRAIDLVPRTEAEVDLGSGLSLRIVDDPGDLNHDQYPPYEAVLIRADGSLVMWGDDEDTTMVFWYDIICRIQNLFETAIPTTTAAAGLPENDHDSNLPGDALPYLYEVAGLFNFADYLSEASPSPSWQLMTSAEPSHGSSERARSPFSDITSLSILDSPFTAELEGEFSSYTPSVYVGDEDEVVQKPIGERPHSVVETSAPGSFAHLVDQKATREDEEVGYHFSQPITIASCSTSELETATGNVDVDLRGSTSSTRVLKRTHSAMAGGSAPARLTAPLPSVQPEEDKRRKRRKLHAILPAPPPASASGSTPTPTPIFAPAPTFPTRHPCEYCPKTFSRPQDRQRHSRTSCNGSPYKETIVCPECHDILSRVDAAQRHWRLHANPQCETPEWVSSRA